MKEIKEIRLVSYVNLDKFYDRECPFCLNKYNYKAFLKIGFGPKGGLRREVFVTLDCHGCGLKSEHKIEPRNYKISNGRKEIK